MAKRFSGSGFAWVKDATRFSSSARIAIADIAIAASDAVCKPASNSGGAPTDGTSGVRKGGSIIGTGSESTGAAGRKPA
jgi:hypothetical protein